MWIRVDCADQHYGEPGRAVQSSGSGSTAQINMMVNLVEPFSQVDQGRLRVSFAGQSPNYSMTLVVARPLNVLLRFALVTLR